MKISVWGLGYVGTVSAGCLAQEGHEVIGVDSEPTKVDLINAGKSPIIEKDIGRIIEQQVAAGRLSATVDAAVAVEQTDLLRLRGDQIVVDFVRITDSPSVSGVYEGICW
jgi:GDP-mannose 6-dehydrogenase